MNKDFLQIRYSELCAELGHLTANIEKLQSKIEDIKKEIFIIDDLSGRMKAMERLQASNNAKNVVPFTKKDDKDDK